MCHQPIPKKYECKKTCFGDNGMLSSDEEPMQNVHATHCLAHTRIFKEIDEPSCFYRNKTIKSNMARRCFTPSNLSSPNMIGRKMHESGICCNRFHISSVHPWGCFSKEHAKTLDDFFPSFATDFPLEALQFLLPGFAFPFVTFFDFFEFSSCFFFEFDFALAFGFGLSFTTVEFAFFSGPCNKTSNFSAAANTEGRFRGRNCCRWWHCLRILWILSRFKSTIKKNIYTKTQKTRKKHAI